MQMPRELKRQVPSLVQEIAEGRALASMCLIIYGILFVKVLLNDPNGWVTITAPALGPLCAAVYLSVRPLNPFENLHAVREGISERKALSDPAARWLLAFLRSPQATKATWRAAARLSCELLLLAVAGSLVVGRTRDWTLEVSNLIGTVFLWTFFGFYALVRAVMQHAFRSYSALPGKPQ